MRPILVSPFLLLSLLPAQGLHPTPGMSLQGLRTTQLRIRAEVQDQLATTELVQTITNETGDNREALWILPLPEGATADGFTMTVGGVELTGEVLDGDTARRVYQDIVRRKRDPGLLEYAGRGLLRARIFPIPPRGSVDVKVRYRQVLPERDGLLEWSFPLRSLGRSFAEQVSVDLKIRSGKPIRTVFSPLRGIEVLRKGEREAHVGFELSQMPDRDLAVYFGLEDREFGLNLLTWRKGDEPGYFAMILSPKRDWPESPEPRSVQFVVDTSGSMSGTKIDQVREALSFFLGSLSPRDRFNIVTFATEAEPLFTDPAEASEQNLALARDRVAGLQARGGTNIFDALQRTLAAGVPGEDYLPVTVFLTDGRPTVGNTNDEDILAVVGNENRQEQRIFVFGVGNDLNTRLLDRIAEESRGSRDYVREDESIEVKTSALFTRLSHPVLTDMEIDCPAMDGFAIQPRRLPDLFKGDRLVVMGRYRKPGEHTIRLRGRVRGKPREYVYEARFTAESTRYDFVPPLWAERRVAMLLDEIRLHGEDRELLEEVRRLGKEFGIVTPYTSHLILEEAAAASVPTSQAGRMLTADEDFFMGVGRSVRAGGGAAGPTGPTSPGAAGPGTPGSAAGPRGIIPEPEVTLERVLADLQAAGALPAGASEEELHGMARRLGAELMRAEGLLGELSGEQTGSEAVDTSLYLARSRNTVSTGSDAFFMGVGQKETRDSITGLLIRRVAGHTFRLRNALWVDVGYEEGMKEGLVKVVAFSEEYFALLDSKPELAPYFAFSNHLTVVLDGQAYEVTEES